MIRVGLKNLQPGDFRSGALLNNLAMLNFHSGGVLTNAFTPLKTVNVLGNAFLPYDLLQN